MREDGLQAHLQGFSTTDTYNITTVHSSSTSDERTFIICSKCCSTCCTPSNSLLLNWFVARFVLCFCRSERRLSRGGRGVYFRRLRNFYNKKGYYQWATWQMILNEWMNEFVCLFIHSLFIYLCNITDSIFQCVFTVFSCLVFELFSCSAFHVIYLYISVVKVNFS